MNYFTITAGRTGTAWLASFFSKNLGIADIHEPLGIDEFGEKMPDIRTMRNFNNYGNNNFVKSFWERKFSSIQNEIYAETNHTLGKCGLVENIALHGRCDHTTLIILRRNIVKQCVSYIIRNDFQNITIPWQWYLHPTYRLKIVNPQPFLEVPGFGVALWYCYEIAARQEYYLQKFADKIKMIDVELEVITRNAGAQKFYRELGLSGRCTIPDPKNETKQTSNENITKAVQGVVSNINVDMSVLVRNAIRDGFTFETAP